MILDVHFCQALDLCERHPKSMIGFLSVWPAFSILDGLDLKDSPSSPHVRLFNHGTLDPVFCKGPQASPTRRFKLGP